MIHYITQADLRYSSDHEFIFKKLFYHLLVMEFKLFPIKTIQTYFYQSFQLFI